NQRPQVYADAAEIYASEGGGSCGEAWVDDFGCERVSGGSNKNIILITFRDAVYVRDQPILECREFISISTVR
ncbi:MAG: hypothetical protein JAY64_16410, partial [Candidatus Thiodiazotropha weberae]|nr:hypothetical protein [Candidatus Thiodiazotropha lotti]MCW4212739.1 hypothetical protein [Candidatus Thiodiazotropha lotti]